MSKTAQNKPDKDIFWRAFVIYILFGVIAIALIYRMIQLQWIQGSELRAKAEDMSYKYVEVDATRGNIYDSEGALLATSIPRYDIYLDLSTKNISKELYDKNIDSLCIKLSKHFKDRSKDEYKKMLTAERKRSNRYFPFKKGVDYFDLKAMKSFPIFNKGSNAGGFIVERKDRREKPYGDIANRTIGFVRDQYAVGLEGYYNSILSGKNGKRLMKKIAPQVWLPVDDEEAIKPIEGKDIITSLDMQLQDVAQSSLAKHLELQGAHHGCVVLMEVKTGKIKALANLERQKDGSYADVYNFAVGERFEPGSSFKLMSMLVALEDKRVNLEEMVNTGNGRVTIGKQTMTDATEGGYGTISYRDAFIHSSNIGISRMIMEGYSSNPQEFINGLYRIGIQNPVGIDLNGEATPFVKSTTHRSWSKASLPWMSIGYELLLTPLQTLVVYNAVANNGQMVKPYLVTEIQNNGKTEKRFDPVVLNPKIASPSTIFELRKMLADVVQKGTATNLKNAVFPIAGKTATAQIAQRKGYKGESVVYNSSFVGYFPADNPEYSCIVAVNRPSKGKYYGGSVAAPVFLEIAEKIYSMRLDLHRQDTAGSVKIKPVPFHTSAAKAYFLLGAMNVRKQAFVKENAFAKTTDSSKVKVTTYVATFSNRLANVKGMALNDALFVLEKQGMKVQAEGLGRVISQSPESGTPLRKGSTVKLKLGTL